MDIPHFVSEHTESLRLASWAKSLEERLATNGTDIDAVRLQEEAVARVVGSVEAISGLPGSGAISGAMVRFTSMVARSADDADLAAGVVLLPSYEGARSWDARGESLRRVIEADPAYHRSARDDRTRYSELRALLERGEGDVMDSIPVPIIVAEAPRLELTAAVGEPVHCGGEFVTVGAPCLDPKGTPGFITAAHVVKEWDAFGPVGTVRLDDGTECKILRAERSWDAMFVGCSAMPDTVGRIESVLRGAPPGRGTSLSFVGARSGACEATIDSYDPILPYYDDQPFGIARLYTNRATEPGDSGAVLVDDQGRAVGQCHSRTVEGESLEFSIWGWMAGVMDALDVTLA